MAFLLSRYRPVVNYPQSHPRIFDISDKLLFSWFLALSYGWKAIKNVSISEILHILRMSVEISALQNSSKRLKETLEQDFLLHSYMPRFYSFTTQIKADYLISSTTAPVDFIFIIKSSSSGDISICDFVCCSAFMQTKRDYRENQRPRSILKKERVHIATNTTTVLFDRLNGKQ